ncbi:MAG: hypothetical protein ACKO0Z_12275 [Betaproteobacteria bacterium]
MKNPAAVALGRLGGEAGTGPSKARTSAQARAAVQARWANRKPKRTARRSNDQTTMTTEEQIQIIRDVADAVEGDFTDTYSGRGMYGKTCCGVICKHEQDAIEEAAAMGLRGASIDNMGRSMIVYWPRVSADGPNE